MAWNFFQCVCGRFASIDTFSCLSWPKIIKCECGRRLSVFCHDTAHLQWCEYMRTETAGEKTSGKPVTKPVKSDQ